MHWPTMVRDADGGPVEAAKALTVKQLRKEVHASIEEWKGRRNCINGQTN